MSRTARVRELLIPKWVPLKTACEHLGICTLTFRRHWQATFTDARPVELRGKGSDRRVLDDELAEAVANGGDSNRTAARGAVLNLRALLKRV